MQSSSINSRKGLVWPQETTTSKQSMMMNAVWCWPNRWLISPPKGYLEGFYRSGASTYVLEETSVVKCWGWMIARRAYKERDFIGHGLFLNLLVNPSEGLTSLLGPSKPFQGGSKFILRGAMKRCWLLYVYPLDCQNQQMFIWICRQLKFVTTHLRQDELTSTVVNLRFFLGGSTVWQDYMMLYVCW